MGVAGDVGEGFLGEAQQGDFGLRRQPPGLAVEVETDLGPGSETGRQTAQRLRQRSVLEGGRGECPYEAAGLGEVVGGGALDLAQMRAGRLKAGRLGVGRWQAGRLEARRLEAGCGEGGPLRGGGFSRSGGLGRAGEQHDARQALRQGVVDLAGQPLALSLIH
ncbi:hypothetical protein ADK38_13180, partial [Streptomyces varsoviensis]